MLITRTSLQLDESSNIRTRLGVAKAAPFLVSVELVTQIHIVNSLIKRVIFYTVYEQLSENKKSREIAI